MGNSKSLLHYSSQTERNKVKMDERDAQTTSGESGKRWEYSPLEDWWLSMAMCGMMLAYRPRAADNQDKITGNRNQTLPLDHMIQEPTPSSSLDEGSSEESRGDEGQQPGKKSLEDFTFLSVLGRGQFGKVILAELRGTDEVYALKIMKKENIVKRDMMNYVVMERRVLALAGGHPYLTHLYCCFQNTDYLCFAMEFVNGGELFSRIQNSGGFDEHCTQFYAAEIVCALMFLHRRGIVHRDLKPENILLDAGGHCKLADFGLCKDIRNEPSNRTVCGTPEYMAPEMIRRLEYGTSLDWWALGVIIYDMLMCFLPFEADNRAALLSSILNDEPYYPPLLSTKAVSILKAFLQKDPRSRLGCVVSRGREAAVTRHPFFEGINWSLVEQRKVTPPFQPPINTKRDVNNFEKEFTREEPRLSLVKDHLSVRGRHEEFRGFSFINTEYS